MLAVSGSAARLPPRWSRKGWKLLQLPIVLPAGDLSLSGFTPRGTSAIALTPALLEQRGDRG